MPRPSGRVATIAHRLRRRERLWARVGLRGRVTITFGLGALLLSLSMGGLSYFTTRHFLVGERESAAVSKALSDAGTVQVGLNPLGPAQTPTGVIDGIDLAQGSGALIIQRGLDYPSGLGVGVGNIPGDLRSIVDSGEPAMQTFRRAGTAYITVGIPIPSVHAQYYEIFDLSDLEHTLRVLLLALAAAGVLTTLLGAGVGRFASGRSLRPLTSVSRAATAIAGGQLDTRLPEAPSDPDLSSLTSSFNLMVDQLEERIQREARFNSDVSHELRSPLTTLSATLAVLEAHQEELAPRARQALALLGDDLRRFQRMVADLLEISRSGTGSADVVLEEVTVGELVRRAVAAGARSLPRFEPPPVAVDPNVEHAHLRIDKRRFERVMANLLENAAFYGGGATRVETEPGPPDAKGRETVRVAVEDGGPGVPETERAKVFERFYRGQASGRRGAGTGTGLGLSLVAEHVRLNGGQVWAEAADGGGARFVVELPLGGTDAPEGGDEDLA